MSDAPTLKPCPFCGGKAELEDHGDMRWVTCTSKTCAMWMKPTDETAIAAWNTRQDPLRDSLRAFLNDQIGDCRFDILEGRGDADIEVRWRTYEKVLEWLDRERK